MNEKGQASIEYLLLVGAGILIAAIVIATLFGGSIFGEGIINESIYRYNKIAEDIFVDNTPPSIPTIVAVSAGDQSVYLEWTESVEDSGRNASGLDGYSIIWSNKSRADPAFESIGHEDVGKEITSYTINGLVNGKPYYFSIKAFDKAGNYSDYSNEVSITPHSPYPPGFSDNTGPEAPKNFQVYSVSYNSIDGGIISLKWSPPLKNEDGGTLTGLQGYKIEKIGRGIETISDASTTTYTENGLTPESTYCYKIKAFDEEGNEGPSTTQVCGTIPTSDDPPIQTDIDPPEDITDFTAITGVNNGEIRLNWTAPDEDSVNPSGNSCTTYDIRYSLNPITEENFEEAIEVLNEPSPASPGTLETLVVSNLTPLKGYYFAIKASDEVPNWSEITSIGPQQPQFLDNGKAPVSPFCGNNCCVDGDCMSEAAMEEPTEECAYAFSWSGECRDEETLESCFDIDHYNIYWEQCTEDGDEWGLCTDFYDNVNSLDDFNWKKTGIKATQLNIENCMFHWIHGWGAVEGCLCIDWREGYDHVFMYVTAVDVFGHESSFNKEYMWFLTWVFPGGGGYGCKNCEPLLP